MKYFFTDNNHIAINQETTLCGVAHSTPTHYQISLEWMYICLKYNQENYGNTCKTCQSLVTIAWRKQHEEKLGD